MNPRLKVALDSSKLGMIGSLPSAIACQLNDFAGFKDIRFPNLKRRMLTDLLTIDLCLIEHQNEVEFIVPRRLLVVSAHVHHARQQ